MARQFRDLMILILTPVVLVLAICAGGSIIRPSDSVERAHGILIFLPLTFVITVPYIFLWKGYFADRRKAKQAGQQNEPSGKAVLKK
jgi:hypothetical protein